jgi:hypothetical protein
MDIYSQTILKGNKYWVETNVAAALNKDKLTREKRFGFKALDEHY